MFCLDGNYIILQIPIPELLFDDLKEVKAWKWSVRKAKKINRERHSQRCDTELKLSVRFISISDYVITISLCKWKLASSYDTRSTNSLNTFQTFKVISCLRG